LNAKDLLHLVLSNLGRMKARVAMTAVGVVVGTAAVVVLVSLAAGLQRSTTEQMGSIGDLTEITVYPGTFLAGFGGVSVGSAGEELLLTERALDGLRDMPGVVAVTPYESFYGAVLRLNRLPGTMQQVVGIDPSEIQNLGLELESGIDRLGRWQALVGARVAEGFYDPRTGRPVEDPPELQGQTLQLTVWRMAAADAPEQRMARLRVTGVLEESGGARDYAVFVSVDDLLELEYWSSGQRSYPSREGYDQALVKVATPEQVPAVEQAILRDGYYAYSAQSMLQGINITFLIIQGVFGGIGAIALVVAAFGIANTMSMAIYERTREIGLMKAVGATNRDVMSIFLAEAGCIGVLGGVIGVILGVALGAIVDVIATAYIGAQAVQQGGATAAEAQFSLVYTPFWLLLFAIAFSAAVGVISGIYPAMRAAALSPVAALKYE
jgi:putative ABC transport system permease protein